LLRDMARKESISIIMPAYNEEKRIGSTLKLYSEYLEKMRKKEKFEYEILVVINNTKDKTEDVVKTWRKKNKRINYINLVKGGKGYAVIEGFKNALKRGFDFIGFVDADAATPPEAYHLLIKNINGYDGSIASRYVKGSAIYPRRSFVRTIVGRTFNYIVRALFMMNYKDTQCGAKLFRRKTLEKIIPNLGLTNWAFDVELLYECSKNGFQIKEEKTKWKEVDGSKVDINKTSLQMLSAVLQLRILKSKFKHSLKIISPGVSLLYKLIGGK